MHTHRLKGLPPLYIHTERDPHVGHDTHTYTDTSTCTHTRRTYTLSLTKTFMWDMVLTYDTGMHGHGQVFKNKIEYLIFDTTIRIRLRPHKHMVFGCRKLTHSF